MSEVISVLKATVRNLKDLSKYNFDDRYVSDNKGTVYLIKEELVASYKVTAMSPFKTSDGYIEYVLTDNKGKKKHIQGQRIVAGLYLKSVHGKEYVNHKDGDKANNKYTNLEYMSHPENIKHTYDKLGRTPWNKGKSSK